MDGTVAVLDVVPVVVTDVAVVVTMRDSYACFSTKSNCTTETSGE